MINCKGKKKVSLYKKNCNENSVNIQLVQQQQMMQQQMMQQQMMQQQMMQQQMMQQQTMQQQTMQQQTMQQQMMQQQMMQQERTSTEQQTENRNENDNSNEDKNSFINEKIYKHTKTDYYATYSLSSLSGCENHIAKTHNQIKKIIYVNTILMHKNNLAFGNSIRNNFKDIEHNFLIPHGISIKTIHQDTSYNYQLLRALAKKNNAFPPSRKPIPTEMQSFYTTYLGDIRNNSQYRCGNNNKIYNAFDSDTLTPEQKIILNRNGKWEEESCKQNCASPNKCNIYAYNKSILNSAGNPEDLEYESPKYDIDQDNVLDTISTYCNQTDKYGNKIFDINGVPTGIVKLNTDGYPEMDFDPYLRQVNNESQMAYGHFESWKGYQVSQSTTDPSPPLNQISKIYKTPDNKIYGICTINPKCNLVSQNQNSMFTLPNYRPINSQFFTPWVYPADPKNNVTYKCSNGKSFQTYDAETLTRAQKELVKQKELYESWPFEDPSHYACAQGCDGTCTPTNEKSDFDIPYTEVYSKYCAEKNAKWSGKNYEGNETAGMWRCQKGSRGNGGFGPRARDENDNCKGDKGARSAICSCVLDAPPHSDFMHWNLHYMNNGTELSFREEQTDGTIKDVSLDIIRARAINGKRWDNTNIDKVAAEQLTYSSFVNFCYISPKGTGKTCVGMPKKPSTLDQNCGVEQPPFDPRPGPQDGYDYDMPIPVDIAPELPRNFNFDAWGDAEIREVHDTWWSGWIQNTPRTPTGIAAGIQAAARRAVHLFFIFAMMTCYWISDVANLQGEYTNQLASATSNIDILEANIRMGNSLAEIMTDQYWLQQHFNAAAARVAQFHTAIFPRNQGFRRQFTEANPQINEQLLDGVLSLPITWTKYGLILEY